MIILIITVLISLGINIYQALKLFKYSDDKKLLTLELLEEKHTNEINKSVITNLTKKVQNITYDEVGGEKPTIKKSRSKK